MVLPVKPAAPPVRTFQPPPGIARPWPFRALLTAAMKAQPKPAAPPVARAPSETPRKIGEGHPKACAEDKPAPGKPLVGPHVGEEEKPRAKAKAKEGDKDAELLDPSTRLTAQLAPPLLTSPAAANEPVAHRARVSLEELVPQVLRRIAWGGDRTKGSVLLELASGDKVTVHAEGGRVRLQVEGDADLERRIGSRLRAAGIEVEGVR